MAADLYGHDAGALDRLWQWVDPKFGVIRHVTAIRLGARDPRWWVYACELARAPVGTWHSLSDFSAAGCSIDPNEALRRAFGEAIERYCGLAELDPRLLVALTPDENALLNTIPVCAIDEPCSETFKYTDPKTPLTCFPMHRLSDDQTVYVPAAYAGLTFTPPAGEPVVALPISTGLAFNTDFCTAVWRGLCEAAERDAMMLMWWAREAVSEIVVQATVSEPLMDRLFRLNVAGLKPHLFDITTDFLVPTVFCIIRSDKFPYLVVGAACHEDPVMACTKALDEAVSGRVAARFDKWSADIKSFEEFNWVQRLEHHMILYASWKDSPAFEFLLGGNNPTVSFEDFSARTQFDRPFDLNNLRNTAVKLKSVGFDTYYADLTTPEAAEFGSTVKVFVPQMVPLSQDHRVRWLGSERLHRRAKSKGTNSFNPFPHPFA